MSGVRMKNKMFVCKEKYKNNRCYIITTCKNRAKFLFYLEYNECKWEDITCNLVEGVNVKKEKEQMLKETSPLIKSLGIGSKDANINI